MTVIREMRVGDVADVAVLAQRGRQDYAAYQPQFWRVADDAEARHAPYVEHLVNDPMVVTLVAEEDGRITGFLIGSLVPPPPVYDPGGPSGFIDDFSVADDSLWATVGRDLLGHGAAALRSRGAVQVVVVCAHLHEAKRIALTAAGLSLASEWYVGSLTDTRH